MVVTPGWIDRKMVEKEVRIKQIAFDTGLDRKDISGWVTGEKYVADCKGNVFFLFQEFAVKQGEAKNR